MKKILAEELDLMPSLKLAVIGHVEWVTFLDVDNIPKPGIISHANRQLEEPAGGGALVAVKMASIKKNEVHFFTSLGKDNLGEKSFARLNELGVKLNVAWRDLPTRKGISLVDSHGDRAITVIGERLEPKGSDSLPWNTLKTFDAVFITAGDSKAITYAREAKKVLATPRVDPQEFIASGIEIDALIGSGLDPYEIKRFDQFLPKPKIVIKTEGKKGGEIIPGGRFNSVKLNVPIKDSYGCGDCFAAGVTTGYAANWSLNRSIHLGTEWGAINSTFFGPYK